MNTKQRASDAYEKAPYPKTRRAISDMLREGQRKHMVRLLTEVDVTEARDLIRERKAGTGQSWSFTGVFIAGSLRNVH